MARVRPQFTIVTEFAPPPPAGPAQLARALSRLRIVAASASLYACTADWRIPRRRTRQDLALLAVAGRGRMSVDGRWLSLARNRLVYAARGSWIAAETDPAAPLRVIVLAHRADCSGGVPFAMAAGLPAAVQLRDEDRVEELLLLACREDAQRAAGSQVAIESAVAAALVAAARRAGPRCRPPSPGSAAAMARIAPALAVMVQDLSHPLRMRELALACGVGAAQFRRLFIAALGTGPVGHLRQLRLEEAQRLIAGGALAREAAEAVGYRSTACLDRLFRSLAGTTPGAWRERLGRSLR